jgi:hypothetical protein
MPGLYDHRAEAPGGILSMAFAALKVSRNVL